MERDDILNFLVTAYQHLTEHGLSYDLDDPDNLRVAFMTGPMTFVPARDAHGGEFNLLLLAPGEGQDSYLEHCVDAAWPHFENDLRDRLAEKG